MDTYIAYFDETGDDGATTASSDVFVLTSAYMSTTNWQENFDAIKRCRKLLKDRYGFHVSEEFHTKHMVRDKGLYRSYGWTDEQRREILCQYATCIAALKIKVINILIDKTRIHTPSYDVLKTALTYNIQRIENDSNGEWKYMIITDQGRIAPMRRTAREIRAYNPVHSHFGGYQNQPIRGLVEDIMEKDSTESYFIQICDFISFFANLYYKSIEKGEPIPRRVERVADRTFIEQLMEILRDGDILNLKASARHPYGFVVYPK